MKRISLYLGPCLAAFLSSSALGWADEQLPSPVGFLTCDIASQLRQVLQSKQDVACRFVPSSDRAPTFYIGHIVDHKIDYGEIEGGQMTWRVFGVNATVDTLVDKYTQVEAPSSLHLAAGVKILAGERRAEALLEPFDIEGKSGGNFSEGITSLTLRQ